MEILTTDIGAETCKMIVLNLGQPSLIISFFSTCKSCQEDLGSNHHLCMESKSTCI
jgi:hypothetical protein